MTGKLNLLNCFGINGEKEYYKHLRNKMNNCMAAQSEKLTQR